MRRAIVIGAGIGGLAAAIDLARAGVAVELLERFAEPGGKMRGLALADGTVLDGGPTVLTLPDVFASLFDDAGAALADAVPMRPATVLARHWWPDGSTLDLHADRARTRDAIGRFAGAAELARFDAFSVWARTVRRTLDARFMRAPRPGMAGLVRRCGPVALARAQPFGTLAGALARRFRDRRLRQLYGRYATYCGASPYRAPATLALIADVEADGVWLPDGGMRQLAGAMAALAERLGARLRTDSPVARITVANGRADGVVLADGERIATDAVLFNGDTDALAQGLLGDTACGAARRRLPGERSLSAITWAMRARVAGPALARHNVVFAGNARQEFDDVFRHNAVPGDPTVYLCAQDRDGSAPSAIDAERLLVLINAPPIRDDGGRPPMELDRCRHQTIERLARNGITLEPTGTEAVTGPSEWAAMFPGSAGALYGPATHGPTASFRRPGSRSAITGLYLAGGSVHPGPGVPMAALSGRLAAAAMLADRGSRERSRPVAMPGGMSTRSRPTG